MLYPRPKGHGFIPAIFPNLLVLKPKHRGGSLRCFEYTSLGVETFLQVGQVNPSLIFFKGESLIIEGQHDYNHGLKPPTRRLGCH